MPGTLYRPGDEVRFICADMYRKYPRLFPLPGTIGEVIQASSHIVTKESIFLINWDAYPHTGSNCVWCREDMIEPVGGAPDLGGVFDPADLGAGLCDW